MKKWFIGLWRKWKRKHPTPLPPIKEIGSIFTIVLLVGHKWNAQGATAAFSPIDGEGLSEYEYWSTVVKRLHIADPKKHVKVAYRDGMNIPTAVRIACRQFSDTDLLMELHFNASSSHEAHGCEVIYGKDSRAIADKFCRFMEGKGKRYRRLMLAANVTSGRINVETGQKYAKNAILIEPFFGDNKTDYIPITAMAEYLSEFIEGL